MGWLERREQRRRQQRELETEDARLRGLTPQEIAKKVLASDLAECLPTGDRTKLAEQIAQLTDHERYILAMAAEGKSAPEIARWLFDPLKRVHTQLRRILEQHLGVAHGAAGDWLVRRRKKSEGY
jgi:DNA-binding NarL/FixJ family response regulator